MATEVIKALGIDKQPLDGHLVVVCEERGANANFLLNCIIGERVRKKCSLCLVTFHQTFRHYQHIGTKFGYDLNRLTESGRAAVIDPYKYICASLARRPEVDDVPAEDGGGGDATRQRPSPPFRYDDDVVDFFDANKADIIVKLYLQIKSEIVKLIKNNKSVCLLIDDLSHLLDLQVPLKDIIGFKQLVQFLLNTYADLSIVINVGVMNPMDLILANSLRHISDMTVRVSALKTGPSSVVSGVMKITRRRTEDKQKWGLQNEYHFKLLDRQVSVYPLGALPANA